MHHRLSLYVKIGLNASEVTILTLRTRSVPEEQKQLRTLISKLYWMKINRIEDQLAKALNMTRQGISKWKKFRRKENWYRIGWLRDKWQNRKATFEILLLLHERKTFLHKIVTGDRKFLGIYFYNSKTQNIALRLVGQKGIVCSELLKAGETVNGHRYRQQLINLYHALLGKEPDWDTTH